MAAYHGPWNQGKAERSPGIGYLFFAVWHFCRTVCRQVSGPAATSLRTGGQFEICGVVAAP